MGELFDIFKYILPALIVFLTSFYTLKLFLRKEYKNKVIQLKMNNQKLILPIRLQAYERIALLLERIALNNLIIRVHKKGMSARLLQAELLKTIRTEFEHNLSQQIYISSQAWGAVKTAKEETIKAINIAATKVSDDGTGIDLSRVVFDLITKVDKLPTELAIEILKAEVRQVF